MDFINYSLFIFIIVNIFLVTKFGEIKLFHYILDKPDKKRKFHLKQIPPAGGIILIFIKILYIDSFFINVLLIFLIGYSFLNYQNKSFLGDGGSLLIAFIIGYIFIKLYNIEKIIYVDEVFIFMMVPGIDLIRLVFKRVLNSQNPLRGDRNHLHHLVSAKFSFIKSTMIVQFLIIAPLLMLYFDINRFFIIIVTIFIYFLFLYKLKKIS